MLIRQQEDTNGKFGKKKNELHFTLVDFGKTFERIPVDFVPQTLRKLSGEDSLVGFLQ